MSHHRIPADRYSSYYGFGKHGIAWCSTCHPKWCYCGEAYRNDFIKPDKVLFPSDKKMKLHRLPEGSAYIPADARLRKPLVPDKIRKKPPPPAEGDPRVGRIPPLMFRWREAVARQRAIEAARLDAIVEKNLERDRIEYEYLTGERGRPPAAAGPTIPAIVRPVDPDKCGHPRSSWEINRGRGAGALYRCHACGTYIVGPKIPMGASAG